MINYLVDNALAEALRGFAELSHSQRSSAWVSAFAEQLSLYSKAAEPQTQITSFCRGKDENRSEFRTNELLFDILVAETRPVEAVRGKQLQALTRVLWVVESELKRSDSRDILIDLNKLVIAKSDNKVLVISTDTSLVDWAKETIAKLLNPEESNVFLVTIPHPETWSELTRHVGTTYQLSAERRWLTTHSI